VSSFASKAQSVIQANVASYLTRNRFYERQVIPIESIPYVITITKTTWVHSLSDERVRTADVENCITSR
jgi:hypothetical protein